MRGDPAALRPGAPRSSRPTSEDSRCRRGSTRSCWSPRCTSRRCVRWPTPRPRAPTRSRPSPSTSTRTRPTSCWRPGTPQSIPVPLKVLASPYREITKPVLDYVRALRRKSPRDVVTVYIPEYVVGPLVGADPAQPERAAAEGAAAVHPWRHGDVGALPAAVVRQSPSAGSNGEPRSSAAYGGVGIRARAARRGSRRR